MSFWLLVGVCGSWLVGLGLVLWIMRRDFARQIAEQRDRHRTRIVGRSSLRAWTRVTLCCHQERAYLCRDRQACQREQDRIRP